MHPFCQGKGLPQRQLAEHPARSRSLVSWRSRPEQRGPHSKLKSSSARLAGNEHSARRRPTERYLHRFCSGASADVEIIDARIFEYQVHPGLGSIEKSFLLRHFRGMRLDSGSGLSNIGNVIWQIEKCLKSRATARWCHVARCSIHQ